MTINSEVRVAGPFLGNDVTVGFPFTFKVFAADEVLVVIEEAGVETVLELSADYTVTLNADQEAAPGGQVTLVAGALASGKTLTLTSALAPLQPVDLTNRGGFYPRVINASLDRLTILVQQLSERLSRTLVAPISDGGAGFGDLPGVSARKGSVLAFDEVTGAPRVGPQIGAIATVVVNTAAINAVANNITDVNIVAANVEDVTNFADVYYGPSATDPSTRRDGSPLQKGDLYFSTEEDAVRAYDGARWGAVASGSISSHTFSGDGVTTDFVLPSSPGAKNNTQVYISGVYQQKGGYSLTGVGGTTLSFSSPPPAGTDNIEVITLAPLPVDPLTAADITDLIELRGTAVRKESSATTGAAVLPSGNNAQRPGAPVAGMVRYNSEEEMFEGYRAGEWKDLGGDSIPLFSVMWWPQRSAIPAGYVAADGQTLSRATYPDALAGIVAGNVPTVADATWNSTPTERGKYTVGNGTSTFRLPDYNGKFAGSLGAVFMRGDGALSAAVAGVIQQDAMQGHYHRGQSGTGSGTSWGSTSAGAGTSTMPDGPIREATTDGTNGTPRTANETRTLNVTGCWVIKLFGAVTNVGSADAAQLATDYANLAGVVSGLSASKLNISDKRVCSAWVNFSVVGTTVNVLDGYNVGSIIRNGAGDFTLNFTTPLANANYAETVSAAAAAGSTAASPIGGRWPYLRNVKSTTQLAIYVMTYSGTGHDPSFCSVHIFGGK